MGKNRFFVTGTDTEIGKTFVTSALIKAMTLKSLRVAGYKPVASDATYNSVTQRYENSDALALLQQSNIAGLSYEDINPYCFEEATSPHIASRQAERPILFSVLSSSLDKLAQQADVVVVEGAGGWFTPLSQKSLFSDWVMTEKLPVILVVGMRLGCINHALLTQLAIQQAGLDLVGWVANYPVPMIETAIDKRDDDYLQTLHLFIKAPLLGKIPYLPNAEVSQLASYLDLSPLI